ncbi:MAG: hypothetical protein ACI81T_002868, partial [Bacteroidia bacterium]
APLEPVLLLVFRVLTNSKNKIISSNLSFVIPFNQIHDRANYYLNSKKDTNYWTVRQLRLKKDTLLIGQITPSDTLLRFDFVSRKIDSTTSEVRKSIEYLVNSSRKNFKSLLKESSFEEAECYCRKK